MVLAALPKLPTLEPPTPLRTNQFDRPDWRTGTAIKDWRMPVAPSLGTGAYVADLPKEAQGKPAFRSSSGSNFWDSVMGAGFTDDLTNLFGGQGVGKVYSGPGFGQFTADADREIQAAAEKYGVPANFLKSIIARESSGNWAKNNWLSNIRPKSGPLMPYVGVFKDAADSRGLGALFQQAIGNRAKQIELLAGVLRSQYDQIRREDPNYGWTNVATYHFAGRKVPTGWRDENGLSDIEYTNKFLSDWKLLDSRAGNQWNNYSAPSAVKSGMSGIGSIANIFGGQPPRISQEFGLTAFATQGKGKDWYGYAANHGGAGHVGIDYSLNPGSKLYAPTGGTVVRSGGSGSFTDERYGNRPGTGELRLKLDNGDEVILGHMGSINVKVGQRVNAGDFVGLSGTYNGGHVHVEYRKYTGPGTTKSGFQVVDPRQALSGIAGAKDRITPAQQQAAQVAYLHGEGIKAARAAAAAANTSDLARLVYDQAFLTSKLGRLVA